MKKALGIGGFPVELSLNRHPLLPLPAVNFEENPISFGNLLNQKIKIFVTPTEYFTTKFREIFTQTKITHNSGAESNKRLSGPNMIYWAQQLNFAFWCATTSSGISRNLINSVPEQIKSFLLFHIYFTTMILFEMGGIQSEAALPGDPTFNQTENKYDIPSYKRICAEFGMSTNTDFRFKKGFSHGLGKVFIYFSNLGAIPTEYPYSGISKFSDEGVSADEGNLKEKIIPKWHFPFRQ